MTAIVSSGSNPTAHSRRVVSFYETCLDHTRLRTNPAALAMHFGFWDEKTESHAEAVTNMNRVLAARFGASRRPRARRRLRARRQRNLAGE